MSTLVVIGAGLIGGSVAIGCRRRALFDRIVAIDPAPAPAALEVAGFSEWITANHGEAAQRALSECDLALLAAPVGAIEAWLDVALRLAPAVTDCGSTKRRIVARVAEHPALRRFVPGHPMAGASDGGLAHADPDLFVDRRWILCESEADAAVRVRVVSLVTGLGAQPVTMSAERHDAAVALTSHVPQLLASALLTLCERRGAGDAIGPGFASTTRIAGGPDVVWRDILATNADEIAAALRALIDELEGVASDLRRDPCETERALGLLEAARLLRSSSSERFRFDARGSD